MHLNTKKMPKLNKKIIPNLNTKVIPNLYNNYNIKVSIVETNISIQFQKNGHFNSNKKNERIMDRIELVSSKLHSSKM